jgi:hypothetical protein
MITRERETLRSSIRSAATASGRCAFPDGTGRRRLAPHFGASYMLNDLALEPWVVAAEQLSHSDGGVLVVRLYASPSRRDAIKPAMSR